MGLKRLSFREKNGDRSGAAMPLQSEARPGKNLRRRLAGWRKHQGPSDARYSQHRKTRKTRKLDTTDRPLIAAELEWQPATNSV
jgi:hypothetical protein